MTGQLIVLLFAGQHTSSITSTWLGALLLSNPKAMAEVRAEQERLVRTSRMQALTTAPPPFPQVRAEQERLVPDASSLNYANLLEMDAMRRAITETLRLYPPLILLMRQVSAISDCMLIASLIWTPLILLMRQVSAISDCMLIASLIWTPLILLMRQVSALDGPLMAP